MKNIYFYLLALLSFNSFSQEDCTLNKDAIKGVLEGAKPSKAETHSLTETLTLKNGVKIIYQVGGCAHYAYTFTFENFGKHKLTDRTTVLKLSEKLLKETPVKNPANRDMLVKNIQEAFKTKEKIEDSELRLPCGDANCAINLRESGKLKIGYDFAL